MLKHNEKQDELHKQMSVTLLNIDQLFSKLISKNYMQSFLITYVDQLIKSKYCSRLHFILLSLMVAVFKLPFKGALLKSTELPWSGAQVDCAL